MSNKQTTKLNNKLQEKINQGNLIISVYLTLGYPDLETSINSMIAAAQSGADIIEIGIPFSDPMADGPTIQMTNQFALENGFSTHDLEIAIKKLRAETSVSIVIMTYANVIYQYPLSEFKQLCEKYQIDGVIIPDIPPEHSAEFQDLNPIYLIAPNTNKSRIKQIADVSNNFIYIVSKLGITGGDYSGDSRLNEIYNYLKSEYPLLPRLQGFGIDSKDAVDKAKQNGAHGVIIGSKLLKLLGKFGDIDAVTGFIQNLKD